LGVSDILAAEGQRCLTWLTIFTKNGDRPDLSPSRFGTVTNGFELPEANLFGRSYCQIKHSDLV